MTRPNRAIILIVACLLAGSGVALAHGNHLSVDAQLSDDGTVVVENLFLQQGGYLAIHADDDGSPGRVLAHRRLGTGYRSAVPIRIDEQFWSESGDSTTVWATLHEDDGDGEFEPNGDDAVFRSFGGFAGTDFVVGKREAGKAYVVAASQYGVRQRTDGPTVTVDNVSLAEPGYVVVREVEQDYSAGDAVGHARLEAGVHENVTVELNESFYESLDEHFRLYAAVYEGDGEFDPESDDPVTVGDEPVQSLFDLRKGDDAGGLVNTPAEDETTDESLVNTPTEAEDESLANTPAENETTASSEP